MSAGSLGAGAREIVHRYTRDRQTSPATLFPPPLVGEGGSGGKGEAITPYALPRPGGGSKRGRERRMSTTCRIGFLGAGKMATALAQGWLRAGLATADRTCASDPLPAARDGFARATGARGVADNVEGVTSSDLLVLAVKPRRLAARLAGVRPPGGPGHLGVSVAAGVPLAALQAGLGPDRRLVRVMPNTPCLVGASAAGYAPAATATADDLALVDRLL